MASKPKPISSLLRTDGDAVAIIPFEFFATTSAISEKAKLFADIGNSRIMPPTGFQTFISGKHQNDIVRSMGTLEADFLNSCHIAMVPLADVPLEVGPAMELLNETNALFKNFCANLWLIRDNCVNTDAGYLMAMTPSGLVIHKNDMQLHFHDAHGKTGIKATFSYKEIKQAASWAFESFTHHVDAAKAAHEEPTSRVKGTTRTDRCWAWVIEARHQSDVLIKVAMYITGLEALLSTSNSELSHQLSERVALLHGKSTENKAIEKYRQMKKAYSFRSKALHGDAILAKDQEALLSTSVFLDDLCRSIMLMVQGDETFREIFKTNESIEKFFIDRLFATPA
ncbi:HEPN domain-containing protein [Tropicibacter sp. Alg240-R139]|uniref:HEPN domain-containing protein n=1 Tax=Tropicibacter sp. Alg240-R139 TaxID=2305991 RepID=UPI0013DFC52D|nr:HEPN domain-containing protein [Tropicibacter sp. Alg240-R139]